MLYINLDKENCIPISKQIYCSIRNYILNGILKENEKLPSTRELAKDINVSRNVVIEAYEQLAAEGYLYTKKAVGTFVSAGIILETKTNESYIHEKSITEKVKRDNFISFRTGIPDLKLIPTKKWGQTYKNIVSSLSSDYMDYQDSRGSYELRYQLTNYLRRVRGVVTTPDNIIITNGAAQAFSMLSQLVGEDEYALVENPISYGISNTLNKKKVKIKTIPLDEFGIVTSKLPHLPPKLIFTTPSHQFPTGVILPIKRRIEIIKYARLNNVFIIEDDYDSEFRFKEKPIQSMQALDPDHVVYVGTFSKTFMPSLRMGYMVLPDCLYDYVKNAKYIDDIHSAIFEQLTMAKFIEDGFLDRHIKKMKSIYFKKRNKLIKALKETFKDRVSISGSEAGLHLIASFKDIYFDDLLMNKIKEDNIEITPMIKHYIKSNSDDESNYNNSLIFGYGNTNMESIEEGVKRLYKIIMN